MCECESCAVHVCDVVDVIWTAFRTFHMNKALKCHKLNANDIYSDSFVG